jgi:hypothetical protein
MKGFGSSPGPSSETSPNSARAWILAAWLLLVFPLPIWKRAPLEDLFFAPTTPVDLTYRPYARLWSFLEEARRFVPPAASYTVTAPDPDDETDLFMLSLGLLTQREALPTSFFRVPTRDAGSRARYVLAFQTRPSADSELRLVARVPNGAVYERLSMKP